jgi:transposase
MFFIPSRTPEMNPIEQVWKEFRKRSFKNSMFDSLRKIEPPLSEKTNFLVQKNDQKDYW